MKSESRLVLVGASVFALLAFTCIVSCQSWSHDITLAGVAFSKARTTDTGLIIGRISRDQTIAGRPCRKGWVHLYSGGVPAGFTSSAPIPLGNFVIPPGTWVYQSRDGIITVCAFPHDVEIQGYACRGGSGGSEGVQATFYPSGALKQFFPVADIVVDGIPCASNPFRSGVELYENGRLRSAVLSSEFAIEGRTLSKGTHVRLSPAGKLTSGAGSASPR